MHKLAFTNSKGHTHKASTPPAMHPEVIDTTGLELFLGMADSEKKTQDICHRVMKTDGGGSGKAGAVIHTLWYST